MKAKYKTPAANTGFAPACLRQVRRVDPAAPEGRAGQAVQTWSFVSRIAGFSAG
jgi:hypothetical protein